MLRLPHRVVALLVASALVAGACGDGGGGDGDDPGEAAGDGSTTTTTIAGVSEVGRRRPWDGLILPPDVGPGYEGPATGAALAELAELGAPNVAVVVPLVQGSAGDVPQRHPEATPSDTALDRLMDAAHELDLGVVLELRVEVATVPSAHPRPLDPGTWFHHYGRLADHYAQLAERHEAALLVIGGVPGELADDGAWSGVIDGVRDRFGGPVAFTIGAEDLDDVTFWDELDVIGVEVTSPPEADVPEPIAADLEKAWEPVLAQLTSLAERWSRPVVFTRIGFPRDERAAGTEADQVDDQRRAYEALFTVINQTPAIEGLLVWRWGGDPATRGDGGATFSPEGQPAEAVLRRAWTTPLADDGGDDDEPVEAEGRTGTGAGPSATTPDRSTAGR